MEFDLAEDLRVAPGLLECQEFRHRQPVDDSAGPQDLPEEGALGPGSVLEVAHLVDHDLRGVPVLVDEIEGALRSLVLGLADSLFVGDDQEEVDVAGRGLLGPDCAPEEDGGEDPGPNAAKEVLRIADEERLLDLEGQTQNILHEDVLVPEGVEVRGAHLLPVEDAVVQEIPEDPMAGLRVEPDAQGDLAAAVAPTTPDEEAQDGEPGSLAKDLIQGAMKDHEGRLWGDFPYMRDFTPC